MSGRADVWRRFRRSRLATAALIWVALLTIVALLAPLLANERPLVARTSDGMQFPAFADLRWTSARLPAARPAATFSLRAPVPYSPNAIDLGARLQSPSRAHPMGTDDVGRDVLARVIHGTRVSLVVGVLASAIAVLIGSTLGALAGYYGRALDWLVSRLIEVVLCFPFLFLALAVVALFRPSLLSILIALGLTSWTSEARFMRAEVLRIRELEFAQAARASGAGDARVIFRHLLPNAMAPVLVSANFGVALAILTESALSFLGLGVAVPTSSWGGILSIASQFIDYAWWLALFPGLAIFTTVAAFNLVGERLRESLDPREDAR